jgi:nucleoside-diphosphate-sugar epimerase
MTDRQPVPGTIALTGATGFVGSHILDRLTAAGWQVTALSRRPGHLDTADSSVREVVGTLAEPRALAELVTDADVVVHCAGLVAARRASDFHAVNVDGTRHLIRAAAASPRRPRIILLSSLAAREPQLSAYAASKREAETVLKGEGGSLSWSVVRPPAVYGPRDRATLSLFRQFAAGTALLPNRQGRFSLIYVEDLADAVVSLVQAGPGSGDVLEIDDGTPGGYSWEALVTTAEQGLDRRIRRIYVPRPVQRLVGAISTAVAAVTARPPMLSKGKINEIGHADWVCHGPLLNERIGWQPSVQFARGFAKTLAWYKAEGWI